MKRESSIEALLKKANSDFLDLKRAYDLSLHEKIIREDLKVDIKNIFENLRSCLDYLAHEIFEALYPSTEIQGHLYFPIRPTVAEFNKAVNYDYPNIQVTNKAVYDILEAIQPYHDPWLGQFNKLNNDNKHQNLVEQIKTESRQVTVSRNGSTASWTSDAKFRDGVSVMGVPIDPKTQMPIPNNIIKTEVVVWVDFRFKENGLSVLPFIECSLKNVERIFHDLQHHI